jgi:hypothetical protein
MNVAPPWIGLPTDLFIGVLLGDFVDSTAAFKELLRIALSNR